MMARVKVFLELARKNVWAVLLALYPFADSILAWTETQLPVLQPVLGANAFRYLGLAIVVAKVGLQAWRFCLQIKAAMSRNATEG